MQLRKEVICFSILLALLFLFGCSQIGESEDFTGDAAKDFKGKFASFFNKDPQYDYPIDPNLKRNASVNINEIKGNASKQGLENFKPSSLGEEAMTAARRARQAAYCSDGILNFGKGEMDVDCGGPNCPSCAAGKQCLLHSDCESKVCKVSTVGTYWEQSMTNARQYGRIKGICQAPTCEDGVQNGNEEDIDCGAACSRECLNCFDTDPGEDGVGSILVKGSVTDYYGAKGEDLCVNQAYLREAFCDAKEFLQYEEIQCPSRSFCLEGRCVGDTSVNSCTDPDASDIDGGIHHLTTASDSQGKEQRDSCVSSTTVDESVCDLGNQVSSVVLHCPDEEVCRDGVCVPKDICSQPDPTQSYPGSVVIHTNGGFHLNQCQDETSLLSIVCRWQDIYVGENECANGCSEAQCLGEELICVDNDPDNNVSIGGISEWSDDVSNNDYCTSLFSVSQSKCGRYIPGFERTRFLREESSCPDDTVCLSSFGGVCLPLSSTCRIEGDEVIINITNRETGETTSTSYDHSFCDPFGSPPSGHQRPRTGGTNSCIELSHPDLNLPPINEVNTEHFTCTANEVCIEDQGCVPYSEYMVLCQDSDGGKDIFVGGSISGNVSFDQYYDYCSSHNTLREFSCGSEGLWEFEDISCPVGTTCSNGACRHCSDTDIYNDPSVRGEVRFVGGAYQPDVCLPEGGRRLIQYDCSEEEGVFTEEIVDCEEKRGIGSVCLQGACT